MAKKKKTQLKPVVRGFATTSVPKKLTVEDENPTTSEEATLEINDLDHDADSLPNTGSAKGVAYEFGIFDEECQGLQNYVDKYQEKTEKEINRAIKMIEFERRFSKTFPRLDLDLAYQGDIQQLLESMTDEKDVKPIDEPEDKVLPRLGITYGILRRLGFSEDRVLECLKCIRGIDLEESFEWLYIHCSEEELLYDKLTGAPPRMPTTQTISQIPVISPDTNSDNRHVCPQTPNRDGAFSTDQHLDNKSRIMAMYGSFQDSSSEEEENPNAEYANIRVALDRLELLKRQNKGSDASQTQIEKLTTRLETVKSHYLFQLREAQALYRAKKKAYDLEALKKRLTTKDIESSENSIPSPSGPSERPLSKADCPSTDDINEHLSSDTDIFGGNTSGSGKSDDGGIFGTLLEPMPDFEVANGIEIRLRNMSLPKHWAGRTPKSLLLETMQKVDRSAVISYRILPDVRNSRGKRAAVSIRWDGTKSGEWCMEDVGCWDESQAEQYISTIALHGMTFGHSEGFAGVGNGLSSGSSQTYFRLLPPVFRDLWDELEARRKETEDKTNREVWATLRHLLEPKLGRSKKDVTKNNKTTPVQLSPVPSHENSGDVGIVDEVLKARFLAREFTPEYQEMLTQRNALPIAQYRDEIIATLESHQVMVLSGETGCGKSTQLPSFILEHHLRQGKHCKIYCTEPRRISAISLAQRVSLELGEPPGSVGTSSSLVGYAIRLESNTSRNTRLAFVTNGIALRMLEVGSGPGAHGTAFDEITHIVIDEVHERNLDSDFLLIVLKSLISQRRDLKVVLMSATMDSQKVSEFFGGCPVLNVPGRTFPVDIRFLEDAIEYTGWSIKEGSPYAKRVGDKYYRNKSKMDWSEDAADMEDDGDDTAQQEVKLEKKYSQATKATVDLLDERIIPYDLIIRTLERLCFEDASSIQFSAAVLIFMPGLAEIRRLHDLLIEHPLFGVTSGFRIFPLHSMISSENQAAVFEIPPAGVRKIVISTNIAETGVTIPDITCVIDSGKHREMRFDEKRQISRLVETSIAKSNAAQRRGRAGRVQAGICFHLITQARHESLAENPLPEMLRLSLSDLALRIKILKVKIGSSIEDTLSRAMDPPLEVNVQRAVQVLVEVKALTPTQDITPMGRLLSKFPTDVHLGKYLLIATIFRCLDPALTIAATLSSKSPFLTPFGHEQEADMARRSFQVENSDFLTIHNAFAAWRRASANAFGRKFCKQNFLSSQNLRQIEELRQQFLSYLIDSGFIQAPRSLVVELSRARYNRSKARFVEVPPELDDNSKDNSLIHAALLAGLYPKVLAVDSANGQMRTINNQPAYFHPSSVNFGKKPSDFGVSYLTYFTLMQSKKLYVWETGLVDNLALALLCGDCETKVSSEAVILDRRIKFRVSPKACISLKLLREHFNAIILLKMRCIPLTEVQERWFSLGLKVLSRVAPEETSKPGHHPLVITST